MRPITTTAAARPSLLWGVLRLGSLLSGAGIVFATIITLWAWSGHLAWVYIVSPTVESIGVQAIQFSGRDIVAEPVQVASVNPAKDNNTRLRNLDVELEQAVRGRP